MNVDQISRAGKSQKRSNKVRKKEECLKVVYISSPMKVKTSASQFRSLVQQLTGKHSDISQYTTGGGEDHDFLDCCANKLETSTTTTTSDNDSTFQKSSNNDTPTSSDYSLGHMDNVFGAIFSSDSFYDPSQMDVLGSFDELL